MSGWRAVRAAMWFGAGDVRVVEVAAREPGEGEIRLTVAYCGICGSDLHEYVDGPHAIPVCEPHPLSGRRAPLVLGHEFCGAVNAVGPRVSGVEVGDRVAVEPNYRCGSCRRCRAGQYNVCDGFGFAGLMGDGGLAEQATVPAYMAHRLSESVSLRQAALFEPAAVALHALRRGEVGRGQRLLVVGLGPIGLLVVSLAAACGVRDIAGVDVRAGRRERARALGARVVFDAASRDVARRVRRWCGREGVDVAFEVAGTQAALDTCVAATRRSGRVVLLGLGSRVELHLADLVNSEQSLVASVGYRDVYPWLGELVGHGWDPTEVVTATVGLDEVVARGLDALRDGGDDIKILVRPDGDVVSGGVVAH